MKMDYKVTNIILAGTMAWCLLSAPSVVFADDTQAMEKCYGIAKAGQTDCDTTIAATCDKSVIDADPNYFLYVPKGVCNKIVGGMTMMGGTPKTTPSPNVPALAPGMNSNPSVPATPPPPVSGSPSMPDTPSIPGTPPSVPGTPSVPNTPPISTGTGY